MVLSVKTFNNFIRSAPTDDHLGVHPMFDYSQVC
jgi:hypothetical protein